MSRSFPPTVGLRPWGNGLEDSRAPSGLALESFRSEFTGSCMFGWTQALASAGVRTEDLASLATRGPPSVRRTFPPGRLSSSCRPRAPTARWNGA